MTAPDPTILAAAIKCAEEDLHLQRDIDDPEVNKVRALVAAAKAYQPMREALEKISAEQWKDRSTVSESNAWPAFQKLNRHVVEIYAIADAALTPAGPA